MVLDEATLARAKEEYDRQGFTLVKGFLRGEALATTQREAAAYLADIAPAKPESEAFYIEQGDVDTIVQTHEMYETDFWLQLPWSDDWLQLARACGGTDALGPKSVGLSKDGKRFCKSLELHQKGPGGKSVRSPPHQDNWYFNLVGGEVPTIWVAMERVDAENGCLHYVPGTHTQPLRTHVLSELRGFSQMVESWTEEDEAAAIPVVSPPFAPLPRRCGICRG